MAYDDAIYSSNVLGIASDANYSAEGDAYDGTPTKVSVSAGVLAQGERPKKQRAAQHQNWINNQIAQILQALHDDGERVEDWAIEEFSRIRALNWPQYAESAGSPRGAHYQTGQGGLGRWWILDTTDQVVTTRDQGHTLSTNAGLTAVGIGQLIVDMASAGSLVLLTADTGDAFYFDGISTWTASQPLGTFTDVNERTHVVRDPINAKWIWCGREGVPAIATSANGTTWADADYVDNIAGAEGLNFGTHSGNSLGLAVNPTTGRVLAMSVGLDGATRQAAFASTTDGGTTWTAGPTIELAALTSDPEFATIHYNEHDDSWLLVASNDTNNVAVIYRSTDNGANWSLVKAFAGTAVFRVACFDGLLIATAKNSVASWAIYSSDGGTTWRMSLQLQGAYMGAFSGGGRPVLVSDQGVYFGLAAGTPALPIAG